MTAPDDELASLRQTAGRLQADLDSLRIRLNQLEAGPPVKPARPADVEDSAAEVSATPESPAPSVVESSAGVTSAMHLRSEEATAPPEVSMSAPLARAIEHKGARARGVKTGGPVVEGAAAPRQSQGGLEVAIGKVWLNRIGAVALLFAAAFFVKLSIDQGWIGPSTRVLLGAFTGLILLGIGEYSLARGMRTFAGGILGCGVGMLYVAVFGAYNFYHLVGPGTAGVLYTAVTVISTGVAIHGKMLPIAILAVIGGYGTPLALSTGTNRQIELLTYVLFLDIGFLVCAAVRRWDILRALAWVGTLGLFGLWCAEYYEPSAMWTTWAFLLAFYVLFHAAAVVSLRRRSAVWPRLITGIVYADNVVFFVATYALWQDGATAWLGLFALLAGAAQWLIAWRLVPRLEPSNTAKLGFWLGGAGMLALAAPLQFDRYLVGVSWLVQAVVTLWFCRKYTPGWLRLKAIGLLVASVIHLFVFEYRDAELTGHILAVGQWYVTWAALLFVFAGLCSYLGAAALAAWRTPDDTDKVLGWLLPYAGSGLLLWLFADQWERYLATWWWLGLAACWWGLARRYRSVGVLALTIAGATALKFMLWDTGAAVVGSWADLDGIVLNRAVLTGVLVSAMLAAMYSVSKRLPTKMAEETGVAASPYLPAVLAAIVFTWTGTFEIARAFEFESWPRTHLGAPFVLRNTFITAWWALNAAAVWVIAGRRHMPLAVYALVVTVLASFKLMGLDTLSLAASGNWDRLSGLCSNHVFLVGLLVIGAGLFAHRRLVRIALDGQSPGFGGGDATALLMLVVLLTLWVPSFEIARAFRFEPVGDRFGDWLLAMHVALSILWSIHATVCLILGFVRRVPALRYFALGLYLITIAKVFLFDLSKLDMVYRIVSFFVLGLLLLFASLLYQRLSAGLADTGRATHDPENQHNPAEDSNASS
jgi:uncharacterized membrane protein